jgi:hypothetical protein
MTCLFPPRDGRDKTSYDIGASENFAMDTSYLIAWVTYTTVYYYLCCFNLHVELITFSLSLRLIFWIACTMQTCTYIELEA